ncbi:hypothetical protein [Peredibacter starrii]|uniref:Cytochrome c domain-containing protein n=1 Tax=Peredibacter starrii TaxID=28202 RepID=A0AAX4HRA4_9BACT|nr:hypothetical protein [Peredibacter starrii]WPU65908.1 hypothetical protein SOO65_04035 [Peredibacter starrii]
MFKLSLAFITMLICGLAISGPVLQMNKAFLALTDLIPFITDRDKFMDKKNEEVITAKIAELQTAFKNAKHDSLLKEDIFAPSYALVNEHLEDSLQAYKSGKKDYAHWRLQETTSLCLDCHTRMPPSHPSSFQNGELSIDSSKFTDSYNLGIAQLIVRRYVDAKQSFTRNIDDKLIKKDFKDLILPFKQVLLIEAKVQKDPANLEKFLESYSIKKDIPEEVRTELKIWTRRAKHWKGSKYLSGLTNDKEVRAFISKELIPLKKQNSSIENFDVDLLFSSGLLSNFIFENPNSSLAPEISYWIGWSEKYLKREQFFGSGDLFLKQCIKKYYKSPVAKQCLDEYRESIMFDFSGSSGTNIPEDVQKELNNLEKMIQSKKQWTLP